METPLQLDSNVLIATAIAVVVVPILAVAAMGFFSGNQFDVKGKRILLTGGSQGMGRSVGRILASKGASVIIVARTESRLQEAIEHISEAAPDPKTHFSYITADLTLAADCARIMSESTGTWGNRPADIVWCCAGTSHPTLLVDTPPETLSSQLTTNYLSAAWTAQAALRSWLGRPASFTSFRATAKGPPPASATSSSSISKASGAKAAKPERHIVFTSSFLALYTVAGYAAYSPTKCAIRSLADTLSQEVLLYGQSQRIRVHTVFPATIFTESYEAENRVKSDLTKMLEEDDEGQTAEVCAKAAVMGLERGQELVPTTFLGRLVMCGVLGGSLRAGGLLGMLEGLLGFVMVLVMPWVRWLYDGKVRAWAKKHGESGTKTS